MALAPGLVLGRERDRDPPGPVLLVETVDVVDLAADARPILAVVLVQRDRTVPPSEVDEVAEVPVVLGLGGAHHDPIVGVPRR